MIDLTSLVALATTEAAEPGFFAQFGINGKMIIAQAVNFGIVAFIIWKFFLKDVIATMDARQATIVQGLQFAEEAKVQLADAEKRQAEVLREANVQAQAILNEARDNAQRFEERVKNETAAQIAEMRRRAEESNELERQKMLSEVRQEVARLVVLTSARVLQRELPAEEKTRLNEAAAREMVQLN